MEPTASVPWAQWGLIGFVVVTGMGLFVWVTRLIVPKAIDALERTVATQLEISKTLVAHGEMLAANISAEERTASGIVDEIRGAKTAIVERLDAQSTKLDKLIDRTR